MSGQHQRNRRKRPRSADTDQAFRGRRKRRWVEASGRLAKMRVQPTVRRIFETLLKRALGRLDREDVFVGYGGVRGGVKDRERRELAQAAGRVPKPGLAELSGCSRSSCIRFKPRILATGLVMTVPGGGTRADGSAIGGRGLATAYRLELGAPPPDLVPPAPKPDPSQLERGRAIVQEAVRRLEKPRGP